VNDWAAPVAAFKDEVTATRAAVQVTLNHKP